MDRQAQVRKLCVNRNGGLICCSTNPPPDMTDVPPSSIRGWCDADLASIRHLLCRLEDGGNELRCMHAAVSRERMLAQRSTGFPWNYSDSSSSFMRQRQGTCNLVKCRTHHSPSPLYALTGKRLLTAILHYGAVSTLLLLHTSLSILVNEQDIIRLPWRLCRKTDAGGLALHLHVTSCPRSFPRSLT